MSSDAAGGQGAGEKPAANAPAVAGLRSPAATDGDDTLSLEGTALSPLDRYFPVKPKPFIALVLALSIGAWLIGLGLAPDRGKFLASPEWRFMPFYLAAHLIAVRLFVTAFTRNFRAGVRRLDVAAAHAVRGVRGILGPLGIWIALFIALPFCTLDYLYLTSPASRYERLGAGNTVGAVDLAMWTTWCVEWFLNALIWVMLVGFLVKNCLMIRAHAFRAPIEIVVHERHYRPFLQMSAQGASILLGFSAITILYLWTTGGELTDYAGLAITSGLLVFGFLPPWILLRRKVRSAVAAETQALRHTLLHSMWRGRGQPSAEPAGADRPTLERRLDDALAIFRISHLEQMQLNLGRREARAIMLRLLAPAIGVAWQLSQNFQLVTAKLEAALKAALAFLSRAPM